jgi:hypothetical protein
MVPLPLFAAKTLLEALAATPIGVFNFVLLPAIVLVSAAVPPENGA